MSITNYRAVDQLSSSLQQHQAILGRLFPSTDPASLQALPRKDLIELILGTPSPSQHRERSLPPAPGSSIQSDDFERNLALEQLHAVPSEYDEGSPDNVADDVNALSLSIGRHSSYVGSSSIAAALKVITVITPGVTRHWALKTKAPSTKSDAATRDSVVGLTRDVEGAYIDAYFNHLHVLVPMLDEYRFRETYKNGTNEDTPWLGLLNMVLALGSIAAQTCLETTHVVYYERARSILTFDSFGSGRIEIVQALALMGGLYLHYVNMPNYAVAITGAALRMAYALGIHRRQPPERDAGNNSSHNSPHDERETKRRTWWSLVCLDTWGTMTLGRPSTDSCFGPAISTPRPSYEDFTAYPVTDRAMQLTASVSFCEIFARLQDRLSTTPCLSMSEMVHFDAQLERVFGALPPTMRSPNQCPRSMLVPRAILKWRYQNARLILHRPTLLAAALSGRSVLDLAESEQTSINICRNVASDSIVDIACDWQPDHICGWNAVWFLFQASMVPLVSLFYERGNAAECGKWRNQVEMALRLLQSMELWSPVAKRSREVIVGVYESLARVDGGETMDGGGSGLAAHDNHQMWAHPQQQEQNMQHLQSPFDHDDMWPSIWSMGEWPVFPFEPMDFGPAVGDTV